MLITSQLFLNPKAIWLNNLMKKQILLYLGCNKLTNIWKWAMEPITSSKMTQLLISYIAKNYTGMLLLFRILASLKKTNNNGFKPFFQILRQLPAKVEVKWITLSKIFRVYLCSSLWIWTMVVFLRWIFILW